LKKDEVKEKIEKCIKNLKKKNELFSQLDEIEMQYFCDEYY
jgi:hypothetical protein